MLAACLRRSAAFLVSFSSKKLRICIKIIYLLPKYWFSGLQVKDMVTDNGKIFDEGIRKAREAVWDHLYNILRGNVITLLHKAAVNREFQGFTGNTQTSYMGGIYINGRLVEILHERDYTDPPRMKKIPGGKSVYLRNPYEGSPRYMRAKVDTSNEYGSETSEKFLRSYKPKSKKGLAICICTGTEYSDYLESVRGLDVLTNTWAQASKVLLSSMRPISNNMVVI